MIIKNDTWFYLIDRNGPFGFAVVHSIEDMGDGIKHYDSPNWFIKICDDVVDNVDAIVGAGMALIKILGNDPDVIVIATGIVISHNLILTTANIIRYVS